MSEQNPNTVEIYDQTDRDDLLLNTTEHTAPITQVGIVRQAQIAVERGLGDGEETDQ